MGETTPKVSGREMPSNAGEHDHPGSGVGGDASRIEAELVGQHATHDPFPAAVRATRMPMVITNPRLPDNPIVFVNDAFCRLSGYAREQIVGRNCRFLQGPDTCRDDIDTIRTAISERRSVELCGSACKKDPLSGVIGVQKGPLISMV
ncbi:PAS domain-containing protein, partial [Sphingomonas glacialis]|uniref:PAS domain-containing protein n=1 Tax=Sphingomonas glacialis TaxID=658225 RepID=UPI0027E50140